MNTITHTALGETHTYEIVKEVPCGFEIWNIGNNAPEGYLPLCRLRGCQKFEGGREIDADALKAIKADGAAELVAEGIDRSMAQTLAKAEFEIEFGI